MEDSNSDNVISIDSQSDSDAFIKSNGSSSNGHVVIDSKDSMSQLTFPESPVYEPEDLDVAKSQNILTLSEDMLKEELNLQGMGDQKQPKRKLSDNATEPASKLQKISHSDDILINTQHLDDEVSAINALTKKIQSNLPSISRVKTPVKSSPRKGQRSNSTEVGSKTPRTPKTPKPRSASADLHKTKTPLKKKLERMDVLKKLDEEPNKQVSLITSNL